MGPWVVIGKFSEGERILGRAGSIDQVANLVQNLHHEHLDKGLEEIWYQSKSSWDDKLEEWKQSPS